MDEKMDSQTTDGVLLHRGSYLGSREILVLHAETRRYSQGPQARGNNAWSRHVKPIFHGYPCKILFTISLLSDIVISLQKKS